MKKLLFPTVWIIFYSTVSYSQMIVKDDRNLELVRITQSGRLGIGVTAPAGSIDVGLVIQNDDFENSQLIFRSFNKTITGSIKSEIQTGNQIGQQGYISFNSFQSIPTAQWVEAMRCNATGVGIGNTNPTALLEISAPSLKGQEGGGTLQTVPSLKIHNINLDNTVNDLLCISGNGEVKKRAVSSLPGGVAGSGVATQIAFWNGAAGSVSNTLTSTANLFWDNNNNRLGIGTTNPQAQLHSTGSVRLQTLAGVTNNRVVMTNQLGDLSALASGTTSQFLRGDGTWAVPPTSTDSQGLTVQAGTATTSIIDISNSANYVTLQAGSNITLSESGNTITISAAGDNLGNHTATSNLIMGNNYISKNGAPGKGLFFGQTAGGSAYVNVNTTAELATFAVGEPWIRHDDDEGPGTIYVWHGLVANTNDYYMNNEHATSIGGGLPPVRNNGAEPTAFAVRRGVSGALFVSGIGYNEGSLGVHHTNPTTHVHFLAGVYGYCNEIKSQWDSFLAGSSVIRSAGFFQNVNQNATDFSIYALGAKNYFEGNVGIGTTNPQSKLSVEGLPPGTGTAVVVAPGGHFHLSTSSRRYKTNIFPLQRDFDSILKVKPISFTYQNSGDKSIGYLAEDFDELGLKDLLIYNEKGEPDAISYEKISVYLIEVIKNLKQEVADLRQLIYNR